MCIFASCVQCMYVVPAVLEGRVQLLKLKSAVKHETTPECHASAQTLHLVAPVEELTHKRTRKCESNLSSLFLPT